MSSTKDVEDRVIRAVHTMAQAGLTDEQIIEIISAVSAMVAHEVKRGLK